MIVSRSARPARSSPPPGGPGGPTIGMDDGLAQLAHGLPAATGGDGGRPAARRRTIGDRRRQHACDIPFRPDGAGDPFHDLLAWESEPARRLPVGSPAGGDASIAVHGSPDAKGLMRSSTPRTLHDLWAGSPRADARDHLRDCSGKLG